MNYPAPSYLTGLVTEASTKIFNEIQENYGDNITVFKFNSPIKSVLQTCIEEFEEEGGTIWGIDKSNNQIIFFDQYKYGYNGLMGLNDKEDLASTKKTDVLDGTEIIIAFQYDGDEVDYLKDGNSKFKQDYFCWVVIYKYFAKQLEEIFSYECA